VTEVTPIEKIEKPKARPRKKTTKPKWKRQAKADENAAIKLHSQIVRGRKQYCEAAAKEIVDTDCALQLQCAHIIRRRYKRTITVLENAWCHHMVIDQTPNLHRQLVVATIGTDIEDALWERANIPFLKGRAAAEFWAAERVRLQAIWDGMQ